MNNDQHSQSGADNSSANFEMKWTWKILSFSILIFSFIFVIWLLITIQCQPYCIFVGNECISPWLYYSADIWIAFSLLFSYTLGIAMVACSQQKEILDDFCDDVAIPLVVMLLILLFVWFVSLPGEGSEWGTPARILILMTGKGITAFLAAATTAPLVATLRLARKAFLS